MGLDIGQELNMNTFRNNNNNIATGRWLSLLNNATMQDSAVNATAAMGAGTGQVMASIGEDFMDLQDLLQPVYPLNVQSQFAEPSLFDTGLGTTFDNETENVIDCSMQINNVEEISEISPHAQPSLLDEMLMYEERSPVDIRRQDSMANVEQVLGGQIISISNDALIRGLDADDVEPIVTVPQIGQFSPLDETSFQDLEKDENQENVIARLRYHSMNEDDYVFNSSPLTMVARQRSMSENNASAIMYQLASSPDNDCSNENSSNQVTNCQSNSESPNDAQSSSVHLDNSFLNDGTQNTQRLIDEMLFPPQSIEPQFEVQITTIENASKSRKKSLSIEDRRNKNNEACRISRKRRREKKIENERKVIELADENEELRAKISKLEKDCKIVKQQVMQRMLKN